LYFSITAPDSRNDDAHFKNQGVSFSACFGKSPKATKAGKNILLDGKRFVKAPSDRQPPQNRKARTRTVIAFLFLLALLAGGGYFIATLGNLQERVAAHRTRAALQEIGDARKLDDALKGHPSNRVLLTIERASKAAKETSLAADKLLSEIEPQSLAKSVDYGKASRGDLDAVRADLKTAEAKATAFAQQYLALLKSERDEVERYALSLGVGKDTLSRFLTNLDKRRTEAASVMSNVSAARADYYRAYERYVAMLEGEIGAFKIVNGEFIFPIQRTVDRYNAAAQAMTAAAKRVAESEEDRNRLTQSQQDGWMQLVSGK
jgi:hypothetical protein